MRLVLGLSMVILIVTGCSPAAEQASTKGSTALMTAERSAVTEAGSEPRRTMPAPAPSGRTDLPRTMPEAVRGQWREDDLGRNPTREDCNQTSQLNSDFGKVLTVDAGGYSLFEDGGRIIDVHSRTENTIDATFDTTYADKATSARRIFALQPNRSLAVRNVDGGRRLDVIKYMRCS